MTRAGPFSQDGAARGVTTQKEGADTMKRTIQPALALAAILSASPSVFAQPIQLNTGFLPDPRRMAGMAGGPVQAQGVQANCRGWIPEQPQHILTTPTGFQFLRIISQASADTTLMVRSTMGTWCADDTYSFNPGVDLNNLPPGRYDIYVGTYSPGRNVPYQLLISELSSTRPSGVADVDNGQRPMPMPRPAQHSLGDLNFRAPPIVRARIMVGPSFDTRSVRGRNGGDVPAQGIRGEGICRGFFREQPNHVMFVTSPQQFMRVFAVSAADSTLVIRRPDGTVVCNDDTYNLNPSVEGGFQPGMYQIWVGTYRENESRPYQLTVTVDPSNHP